MYITDVHGQGGDLPFAGKHPLMRTCPCNPRFQHPPCHLPYLGSCYESSPIQVLELKVLPIAIHFPGSDLTFSLSFLILVGSESAAAVGSERAARLPAPGLQCCCRLRAPGAPGRGLVGQIGGGTHGGRAAPEEDSLAYAQRHGAVHQHPPVISDHHHLRSDPEAADRLSGITQVEES